MRVLGLLCTGLMLLGSVMLNSARAAPPAPLSPWLKAASQHGLEPLDLYAIALQESRRYRPDGQLRPWPWTLHTPSEGGLYFETFEAAAAKLQALQAAGVRNIDVGLLQVNVGWHSHRVSDAVDLLDPVRNIEVGAQILGELLERHGGDLRQAFAHYHNSRAELGEPYAAAVLAIVMQLRRIDDFTRALTD